MILNTIQNARPERVIAEELGLDRYFTGRPCKNGHVSERYVKGAGCVECNLERNARRDKATLAAAARQYRASGNEQEIAERRERDAKWRRDERQRDPERVRARERRNSRLKRQRYPQRKLADTRARQAAKIQRTPPWADLKAIRDFYEACPPGHEVDHVIPLRGKTVSGLHVRNNLQYLPKEANRLKGSKFDPEAIAI